MRARYFLCALALLSSAVLVFGGTTGKIAGTVTDSRTGEKLPSVNVVVEGTSLGANTNIDGYFVVLSVPPGTYRVRASLVGYAPSVIVDVRVNIDQTTALNFSLTEVSVKAEEVIVVAERPVVQKDVSASTTNLASSEFQNLPAVQTVGGVIGLQAGIQVSSLTGDIIIRGGGADQTAFMLDGITLRDERTNKSYTGISFTSIDNVQIQTGGFNAEYGNIRSGVINVTTKEGSASRYSFGLIARVNTPRQKHFGMSPNDRNSFWIRPYVDPAVAWTGTKNGAWDPFTQQQYPEFEGWNSLASKTWNDPDPSKRLTPAAAQQVFLWQHRKVLDIQDPDYDIDASFGGPVPGGAALGNLRFFASIRNTISMYLVPLSTDRLREYNAQVKLTSDIGSGMKLMVEGLRGQSRGTTDNNAGNPGIFTTPASIGDVLNRVSYIDARIFATDYWAPTKITRSMLGGKFTHVLSPSTFYEITAQGFRTEYRTDPARVRDTTKKYLFGNGYYLDEAPFGYWPAPSTGIDGLRMGVGFSNSRDTSKVTVYTSRFDMTSQADQYNQLKGGLEFVYTDNNVNSASVDIFLPSGRYRTVWNRFPVRGAAYLQDKLEFEGMIVNLGLRLDYSNPRGDWYLYSPFDPVFIGEKSLGIDTLLDKEPIKKKVTLSPRLGVSFPITVNSKLYFNYGHFRQLPTPENLFLIRRFLDNNNVTFIANPNNPLPKTVQYELGYEHSLFDQYLFHLAGYYKDVSDQLTTTRYINPAIGLDYSLSTANSYQDIRGFEVTLTKNRGKWIQGFVNYTYMVSTSGRFGYRQFSSKSSDQRTYERDNIVNDLYQSKPVPQPYGRANIDFFTPSDLGPTFAGLSVLGDWRLSLLGSYSAGSYFTWAGGGAVSIPGIQNNVQWKSFYNLDLRLTKTIYFGGVNVQFFMDVTNALNVRYFSPGGYGFKDGNDFDNYMKSLHLPADIADRLNYGNIPGDDRPGDYRKPGVTAVPMKWIRNTTSESNPYPTYLYYDLSTQKYMKYANGQWIEEAGSRVDQVLKDKAYIDMPNLDYFTFLNPRNVFFGIKFNIGL